MRREFELSDEIQVFVEKVENKMEQVMSTARYHLENSLVSPESMVQALEFLVWGPRGRTMVLQCDLDSDKPVIRRLLLVLLGPPDKVIGTARKYGGTMVHIVTLGEDELEVEPEAVFYIGTRSLGTLELAHGVVEGSEDDEKCLYNR